MVAVAVVLGLVLLGGACGGNDGGGDTPSARGAELARTNGCTSCHGQSGEGRLGPPWRGLAGSEVRLADGRTVVADSAYIRRAITDPQAEQRPGYTVPMPRIPLAEQDVDDLVAYVESFR